MLGYRSNGISAELLKHALLRQLEDHRSEDGDTDSTEEQTKGTDGNNADVLTLIGAGSKLWREMKGISYDAPGLESVSNDQTHLTSSGTVLAKGDSEDEIENTTIQLHESTLGSLRPTIDYRRGKLSRGPATGDESSASSIATTGGGSRYDQLSAYLHINQVKHSFYGSPEREDSPAQSPPLSPLLSDAGLNSESQQSPERVRRASGGETADEAGTQETELDNVRATEDDLGIPTFRRLFGAEGDAAPAAPAVEESHPRPGSPVLGGMVTEVVHATWTQCSSTQTSPSRMRSPQPDDEYFSATDEVNKEGRSRPPLPDHSACSLHSEGVSFPPAVQFRGLQHRDSSPQRSHDNAESPPASSMRTSLGQVLARLPDPPRGSSRSSPGRGAVSRGEHTDTRGADTLAEGKPPQQQRWGNDGTEFSNADRSPPADLDAARDLLGGDMESGFPFSDFGFSLSSDSTRSRQRRRLVAGPGRRAGLAGRKAGTQRRRLTGHQSERAPGASSRATPTAPSPPHDRSAGVGPHGEADREPSPAKIPKLLSLAPVRSPAPSPINSRSSAPKVRAAPAMSDSARTNVVGYALRFLLVVVVVFGLQALRMRVMSAGIQAIGPSQSSTLPRSPPYAETPADCSQPPTTPVPGRDCPQPNWTSTLGNAGSQHSDREDGGGSEGAGIEMLVRVRPGADAHQQGQRQRQRPAQSDALAPAPQGVLGPLRAVLFRVRAVLAGVVGVVTRPLRSYMAAMWKKSE